MIKQSHLRRFALSFKCGHRTVQFNNLTNEANSTNNKTIKIPQILGGQRTASKQMPQEGGFEILEHERQ